MEKEKHQLWYLLHKYLVVLAFTPGELGNLKITEHVFDMRDAPLVQLPGRSSLSTLRNHPHGVGIDVHLSSDQT